jgi:methionyl-tRNA formyltransferase
MFINEWVKIKNGTSLCMENTGGTFHLDSDFSQLDEVDLDDRLTVRELVNHLRAKTFDPHPGVFFMHEGKKIYLRIKISRENQ